MAHTSEPTVVWWHGHGGQATYRWHSMRLTVPPRFTSVPDVTWLEYRPDTHDGPCEIAGADGVVRPMSEAEIAEIEVRCRHMAAGARDAWLCDLPWKHKKA